MEVIRHNAGFFFYTEKPMFTIFAKLRLNLEKNV